MKKLYLLSSILFLLFACNSNKEKKTDTDSLTVNSKSPKIATVSLEEGTIELNEESFGQVIELKGKEQKLDFIFNINEVDMLIKGDLLITKSFGFDTLFRVLSLPDFKLLHSFGVEGEGPNEFLYPSLVRTDEEDKICYIYESSKEKLSYLTNDFKVIKCNFSFPKGKTNASSLKEIHVLSNNEILYACASIKGKKIFKFNPDSANSEIEINDLVIDKNYNNWAAYVGSFGVNKKKDRMVYAYNYFREIKFLNLDGSKERKLVFDFEKPKSGDAVSMLDPSHMTYYWKIYACNESVYFTYSGNSPVNWQKLTSKGIEFINIEQYSWDGFPKAKFKLDHLGFFCVDEKRNKLYMISTVAEEPFYVYDLPK